VHTEEWQKALGSNVLLPTAETLCWQLQHTHTHTHTQHFQSNLSSQKLLKTLQIIHFPPVHRCLGASTTGQIHRCMSKTDSIPLFMDAASIKHQHIQSTSWVRRAAWKRMPNLRDEVALLIQWVHSTLNSSLSRCSVAIRRKSESSQCWS